MESQEVLELKITGKNSGGLLVEFGRLQGFIPNSHVPRLGTVFDSHKRSKKKSEMIDSTVSVKVLEIERRRKRLILSARNAREEVRKERLQTLKELEGEVITGPVSNLVDFGAFINLDGVEGLLHISEITWRKIKDPGECLSTGEEIEVLIQSVDIERERVSLSRKALLPDPWELFASTHDEGELLEGVVINVVDFGAFVRVADGIEGLVHTSEISGTQDFLPEDILSPGDEVLVRILQIQPERQRLALSQRRVTREEQLAWIWERQDGSEIAEEEEE
jgi:ribosomal protein S1